MHRSIAISEETIAYYLQPVEPETQAMIDQIWWPWTATKALWATSVAVVNMVEVSASPVTQSEGPSDRSAALGSPATSRDTELQNDAERAGNQSTSPERQRYKIRLNLKLPPNESVMSSTFPDRRALADHFIRKSSNIADVFMTHYVFSRPSSLPPPRGCFNVSGLITLETDKAYVSVAADGWYNPKTSSFDLPSLRLRLTRLSPKMQRPLK